MHCFLPNEALMSKKWAFHILSGWGKMCNAFVEPFRVFKLLLVSNFPVTDR